MVDEVAGHRGGHRLAGRQRRGQLVFEARRGADRLGALEIAGAVGGERGPLGRMMLAAVLAQRRRGDAPLTAEPVELGGQSAGAHRLGLADVTQAPQLRP